MRLLAELGLVTDQTELFWRRKPGRFTRPDGYGAVVINEAGEVLLRRPRGDFEGQVWVFAKGPRSAGESAEAAALRAVRIKTGYRAEVLARIPGRFVAGPSINEFYLMRPVGEPAAHAWETEAVCWARPRQAVALISDAKNRTGRDRDLAILEAALKVARRRPGLVAAVAGWRQRRHAGGAPHRGDGA